MELALETQSSLESFCKQSSSTVILENDDFGGCFEKLVLVTPVYVIISFICAFYIVKASCNPVVSGTINRKSVFYLRLLVHIAIISVEILIIIEQFLAAENIAAVEIVAESFILLSWCLSCFVIFIWRRSWHLITSGRDFDILIASWFLALLSCSVELHSAILYNKGIHSAFDSDDFKEYELKNIYARFALYIFVLILQIPRSNVPVPPAVDEEAASSSQRSTETRTRHPEDSMSFISRLTFWWVAKLFNSSQGEPFESVEHLPFDLPNFLDIPENHYKLQSALKTYSIATTDTNSYTSEEESMPLLPDSSEEIPVCRDKFLLLKALNKSFGWSFWPLVIIKLLELIFSMSSLVLLNLFFHELENNQPSLTSAGVYLGLLVLVQIITAFVSSHLSFELKKLGMAVKGSLISELYSKAVSVNTAQLKMFTVGQILNFATEDAHVISDHLQIILYMITIPLELLGFLGLLYYYIGIPAVTVLAFCVVITPINIYIMTKLEKCEENIMDQRDIRLKLVYEIFSNIKTIKFFNWEGNMLQKLGLLRTKELKEIRSLAFLEGISTCIYLSAPGIITVSLIGMYFGLGGEISVSVLFTAVALIRQLVTPLNMVPWVILDCILGWVSVKRVQNFMSLQEKSPTKTRVKLPIGTPNVIEVDNCYFYWSDPTKCCLSGLQFRVCKGELLVVMGKTGSGKSSLLLALSQELNLLSGDLRLREWRDGAGMVLQDGWINGSTVKEVVLDGSMFDLYWYEQVISACALNRDIEQMTNGDNTNVGVNGSALSGGQRLRLSLARAVYKNKQVYLIDDIFSGLDAHVSLHIIENCINGLLANKTRIICTHNKMLGSLASTLLILENGQLSYIGPPQINSLPEIHEISAKEDLTSDSIQSDLIKNLQRQSTEQRCYGAVKSSVYKHYVRSAGFWLGMLCFLFIVLLQSADVASNIWLSIWTQDVSVTPGYHKYQISEHNNNRYPGNSSNSHRGHFNSFNDHLVERFGVEYHSMYYFTVYCTLVGISLAFGVVIVVAFVPFQLCASRTLFTKMTASVMKAPLSFFDQTKLGIIINRFSSDIYCVDGDVPNSLSYFFHNITLAVGTIVLTCYGLPYILVSFLPLSVVYYYIQKHYRKAVREVKRLYSMAQSPLFSHFEETLHGLPYIHGFRSSQTTLMNGMKILKSYQRAQYCLVSASSWLQLRLELLTAFVIAVASGLVLVEMYYNKSEAARLALGLTFIISINSILDELVTTLADLEKDFVSAERVLEFTEDLPQEVDTTDSSYQNWTLSGNITFHSVRVRYPGSSSLALDNLSFSIHPGQKVAVVGRTGAGKSSIMLALFKLVPCETGTISIDDIDICNLTRRCIADNMTVIAQQSFIMSSSIRENLDPNNQYSDNEILSVVRECQVEHLLHSEDSLDTIIEPEKLSSGQTQLLSLARAILRRSNIICLDEPTSNIDHQTDSIIQGIFQQHFAHCTILCISHRIQSILHYDRVLVISDGKLVEDGDPKILLQIPNSMFAKLSESCGAELDNAMF